MKNKFHFTFNNLENQFQKILKLGYNFTTCSNFYKNKKNLPNLTIVNRVDIDLSVKKAERLCENFNRSKIKATFLFVYMLKNIILSLLKIIESLNI